MAKKSRKNTRISTKELELQAERDYIVHGRDPMESDIAATLKEEMESPAPAEIPTPPVTETASPAAEQATAPVTESAVEPTPANTIPDDVFSVAEDAPEPKPAKKPNFLKNFFDCSTPKEERKAKKPKTQPEATAEEPSQAEPKTETKPEQETVQPTLDPVHEEPEQKSAETPKLLKKLFSSRKPKEEAKAETPEPQPEAKPEPETVQPKPTPVAVDPIRKEAEDMAATAAETFHKALLQAKEMGINADTVAIKAEILNSAEENALTQEMEDAAITDIKKEQTLKSSLPWNDKGRPVSTGEAFALPTTKATPKKREPANDRSPTKAQRRKPVPFSPREQSKTSIRMEEYLKQITDR